MTFSSDDVFVRAKQIPKFYSTVNAFTEKVKTFFDFVLRCESDNPISENDFRNETDDGIVVNDR